MRKTTSITLGFVIATILTAYIAVNFAAAALPAKGPAGKIVAGEQAITHEGKIITGDLLARARK
jgi:hypothetical protein